MHKIFLNFDNIKIIYIFCQFIRLINDGANDYDIIYQNKNNKNLNKN